MEPSIDTRDAPCPSCGHLLWFSEVVPSRIDLEKLKDEVRSLMESSKEMVMKFATKRFGLPSDKMQASLKAVHSAKFEKIEWDRLLKAQCWADVLELVGGCYR